MKNFRLKGLFFTFFLVVSHVSLFGIKEFHKGNQQVLPKLPVVYSPHYNYGCFGLNYALSFAHPFDLGKYKRVYAYLTGTVGLKASQFYAPKEQISEEDLLKVHTKSYLNSLKNSNVVAQIAEILPAAIVPNRVLQYILLEPMRWAVAGTVLATELAMTYGWAINLGGGFHHAKEDSGSGFCVYGDIQLAILKALELNQHNPDYKILIVDLDAHQGNGYEDALLGCKIFNNVFMYDIYNAQEFPRDIKAKQAIDFNHPVLDGITTNEYLTLLKKTLPEAIESCKPNFIIYNAGTDIFEKDQLGHMKVTEKGIIERDAFVFGIATAKKISLIMLLSGGYTKESADIIGHSIENLLKTCLQK